MSGAGGDGGADYAGRRCLVLGADGFIGRWVARRLRLAGAELVAAGPDSERVRATLAEVDVEAPVWGADLVPPGSAARLVEAVRPDQVFNLAGYGVRPDEADPERARRLNTGLVRELCEAVRELPSGVPALVHVGSAAEYGDVGGDLREDGDVRPTTLYGRTKLDGTQAVLEAAAAGHRVGAVARLFTVYGPGEPAHRLLPSLLRAAGSGEAVELSEGTQRRDFTYVEDVAEGLVLLGGRPAGAGRVLNLCTGTLLAVRDFVLTAAGILGIERDALRFGSRGAGRHDMTHEPVAIDRLVDIVGWRPRTDVASGVRRTRDFHRGSERDA